MQDLLRPGKRQLRRLSFVFRSIAHACQDLSSHPNYEAVANDEDETRIQSSKFASTSQSSPDAVLSRWEVMQRALNDSKSQLKKSKRFDEEPFSVPSKKVKVLQDSHSDQGIHGERAVLDWREAVLEARKLQRDQHLEENALTDLFGRKHTYLRISLTERCNLRCLYCMPEEGVPLTPGQHILSSEEIIHLVRLFASAGVNKIRLTGGEPTLRKDLAELTRELYNIEGIEQIGITSNGIVLNRNLRELQANGLSLLNLSLDTLREDRFEKMTRRPGLSRVLATINRALDLGFNPVKVNVVLMRGVNDDEINDFVELTRTRPINVRFIEYMPFDGNIWERQKMVSYREMLSIVTKTYGRELQPLQDPKGEVAKNFRVPGFVGSVSFITSMTSAFCSDCNRLRLMADGNLKVCLFGANEVSLRDALRGGASDEELLSIISLAVSRKRAAHAGMYELAKTKNRAMVQIGG